MVCYCCVAQCRSSFVKDGKLKFHRAPRDKKIRKVWMIKLKRISKFKSHERVCSKHFSEKDYYEKKIGDCVFGWFFSYVTLEIILII